MDIESQDALRDALNGLAEALNDAIAAAGADDEAVLLDAKAKMKAAAETIDNASLQQLLDQPSDKKLKLLADEVATKAQQIGAEEQNVARIAGIATGLLSVANALAAGNIPGALKAAAEVTKIID
jgi:hypothetical protein